MLELPSKQLDLIFSALSDPTRRSMVERLSQKNMTVEKLSPSYPISAPAISKHLRVLEKAGLIGREKEGKRVRVELKKKTLKSAQEWFEYYQQFWNERFDLLEEHLAK